MQRLLAAMLSLITTLLWLPQPRLHAAHATPLFHATREYRDATQFLAQVLTCRTHLNPAQSFFLDRLLHSSNHLYVAALAFPRNVANPLGVEFRQTWEDIRVLLRDLPWLLESLPCEVKQSVTAQCNRFLATFQTLAVQIELSNPHQERRHHSTDLTGVLKPKAELAPICQRYPNTHSDAIARPRHLEQMKVIFISHRTLSPSQWQLEHAEPGQRTLLPIRSENSNIGAKLTRLVHVR